MAGFRRLYLIGDSLTQMGFGEHGWIADVAEHFQRRYDVLNRGFSGYNTDYIRLILPGLLCRDAVKQQDDVAAATIWLGANDAVLAQESKRSVPLERFAQNLKALSRMLEEAGVPTSRQVIIGTPPIVESKWEEHQRSTGGRMNLANAHTRMYARACRSVAEQIGAAHIELFERMMSDGLWPRFFSDGLHLSAEGNRFVAERVCASLDAILPQSKELYPTWSDIDAENPGRSLKDWS